MGIRSLLKSFKIDVDRFADVAMTGLQAIQSIEAAFNLGLEY